MRAFEFLIESSTGEPGKMIMGMLVQTPEQFVRSQHQEQPEEIDEDDEYKPIMFNPKARAQYTKPPVEPQEQPADGVVDPYAGKEISPDEIAKLLHGKNSYVIYYEYKAADDPNKVLEKRVTTEPIYISRERVKELSDAYAKDVQQKFPAATAAQKKLKVYTMLNAAMSKLAVQEAIESSPEVQQAIQSGIKPQKLKAKQFTTQATKVSKPMIHKSSVPIVDDKTGEVIYNLDQLAAAITKRPKQLIKANEKMVKSGGADITIGNFGIPAIVGLVVNEKTKNFEVITTCPGAGECKEFCYVGAGNYIKYAASSENMMSALNYIRNDPNGFKQQMISELKSLVKPGVKVYLRWHDSGDFFNKDYLHLAFDVARAVPEATIYAYTKNAWVVNDKSMPDNFVINFSQGAKPKETNQIDFTNTKYSQVVPASLFKDEKTTGVGLDRLQNRDPEAQAKMKQVLADEYQLDPRTILTYDEMLQLPEDPKNKHKFNVIIVPSLDGDLAAARRDILGSYLLYH
ncbi:MAG: GP88 family protein [Candidatus Nanopelagicus sp.]